jgi:glycosyltransferase involved in cell wall biosynthesis
MKVALFQRVFAHYRAGLVRALAASPLHEYRFCGGLRDPLGGGIAPLAEDVRRQIAFEASGTLQWTPHLAFQPAVVREALSGAADVLILEGSWTFPSNWLALLLARARGRRVLLYTHGWTRRDDGLTGTLRRTFYRLADGLLLYGDRARRLGLEQGFAEQQLHVVYNCLDEESIAPCRQRLSEDRCRELRASLFGPDASRPLLVSVGRLTAAKAYPLLLQAAARIGEHGADVLLVGDGTERAPLAALAAELGVRLALPGARHDEGLLSLCFGCADLAVIPGAAGLTIIHALSYGTPVVIHDNDDRQGPEAEAVEPGVSGDRFHEGSVDSLVETITRVLRDLPRGPATAAACRRVVETRYNPSRMRHEFDRAVSSLARGGTHEQNRQEISSRRG